MLQGRTAVAACAVPVVPIVPTSAKTMSAAAAPADSSALARPRCLIQIKETTLPAGLCIGSSWVILDGLGGAADARPALDQRM